MKRRYPALCLAQAVVVGLTLPCTAAPGNWDHTANIKDAAQRLVKLHRREGSAGVLKFLDACYRTHLLASDFTKGLEACMAQDYMHTKVLATIYAKLPDAQRERLHVPSPVAIADGMNKRFVSSFMQYKVTVTDADDFKLQVDKVGFPLFVKGVFPKGTAGQQDPAKPEAAKP